MSRVATTEPTNLDIRAGTLMRDTLRLALLAVMLGGFIGLAPVGLGISHGAEANHLRIGAKAYGETQRVEVGLNKSMIVDLPADVTEVIVSQPAVAGTIMRSKRRAIIQGASAGGTNIFFLDAAGEAIAVLDVAVGGGADDLVSTLARVIPGSRIQVQTFGDGLVLSGTVQSGDDMQKAVLIAAQFAGGDPNKVANVLAVSGSQQVMLKVTVAEVNREAVKQLGINLNASLSTGGLTAGFNSVPSAIIGDVSQVANPNSITVGGSIGPLSIEATLRALERRRALRTLAEPTLTAISGQPAEFLVGGQLAIPSQDSNGRVTFEFKDFGVKLNFTPTVKSNGIIGLAVETSVSEPLENGSIQERRAKTSVELGVSQTLSIAGLMQDSVRQQISKMPGFGDIPILGTLFRSRDFIHSQTELVILVTPYLAYAGAAPVLPTDKSAIASDAEAIFLGRMEKLYGVGPDGMRGGYDGAVGFVLD